MPLTILWFGSFPSAKLFFKRRNRLLTFVSDELVCFLYFVVLLYPLSPTFFLSEHTHVFLLENEIWRNHHHWKNSLPFVLGHWAAPFSLVAGYYEYKVACNLFSKWNKGINSFIVYVEMRVAMVGNSRQTCWFLVAHMLDYPKFSIIYPQLMLTLFSGEPKIIRLRIILKWLVQDIGHLS